MTKVTAQVINGMWYEELARVDLPSGGSGFFPTIASRKMLRILAFINGTNTSGSVVSLRFNNDTGANYSVAQYTNGGHNSSVSATSFLLDPAQNQYARFITIDVVNIAAYSKRIIWNEFQDGGATIASVPQDRVAFGIWGNTASAITSIQISDTVGGGTFSAGSYCVVLGHD